MGGDIREPPPPNIEIDFETWGKDIGEGPQKTPSPLVVL